MIIHYTSRVINYAIKVMLQIALEVLFTKVIFSGYLYIATIVVDTSSVTSYNHFQVYGIGYKIVLSTMEQHILDTNAGKQLP
jgi:hypothetical protein